MAAGKAANLFELQVDDAGKLSLWAMHATTDRARNAVVDASGNAYLVDPLGMRLLILETGQRGPAR